MLIWVFLVMVATIALFPETKTGKFLRRVLIEAPAEKLNSVSPRRAFFSIVTSIALLAIAPMLIEAAIPMEVALLMAGDMAVYFEAVTMVTLLAAHGRVRAVFSAIASVVVGLARPRTRRVRSAAARRAPRKDTEDERAGLAFA